LTEHYLPGREEQDIDIAKQLRRHAPHFLRRLPLPVSVVLTSFEGRQKFGVETTSFSVMVMRRRWAILSDKFFLEARLEQTLPHGRFFLLEFRRYGDISIQR